MNNSFLKRDAEIIHELTEKVNLQINALNMQYIDIVIKIEHLFTKTATKFILSAITVCSEFLFFYFFSPSHQCIPSFLKNPHKTLKSTSRITENKQ